MIRIAMFHGAGCAGGFQSAPPAHQTTAADTRQSVDAVGIVARRSIAAGASAGCLILHAAGIARPLAAKIAVCVLVAIGWSHPCASEQDPSIASIDRIQQLLNEKKYLDAARQARTLLAEMESRGEVDGLEAAEAMDALVQALEKSGRIREPDVRKYAQLALEIRETHLKPDDLLVAVSLARLARVLDARGEYGPAVALYERSLPITEKATGAGDPTVGRLLVNLGSAYRSKGDYAKGKESCERGLRILEAALGPDHVDVANALNTLANALKAAGDFPGAEAAHRRALAIYESTLGPESAEVARSLNNLGNTLRTVGEYDEAKTLYERAYSINAGKFGTDSEEAAQSQIGVANLYLETGRPGEARPIYELVLAITE
jgi:tetratricopeptide (TPR) repeat protein